MKKIISIALCFIFVFSAVSMEAYAVNADNPSTWTTQQIIDYYKLAASKSNGRSRGTYEVELSGALATIFTAMTRETEEPEHYDGITGNYSKLTASDIKSASARLDGGYVVINLSAKDQTIIYGETSVFGSVTHLVDSREYGLIFDNLFADEDPIGRYDLSNAYAKDVRINIATGKIESGKWGYDLKGDVSIPMGEMGNAKIGVDAVYTVEYPFTPTTINSVDFPEEIRVRYKDEASLVPTVDATSENYKVSYDSSDYNVLNVSSDGKIETYKRGTAYVYCTVEGEDGNVVEKSCKVNVYYSRGQWFIMLFLFGWLWY